MFYVGPAATTLFRANLTLWRGNPAAPWAPWTRVALLQGGPAAYSSMALLPAAAGTLADLGVLYERSNETRAIFLPQHISFLRVGVAS